MATPLVGQIWTAIKAQVEADSAVLAGFKSRYYRRTPKMIAQNEYPMLHVFPISSNEEWLAMPKRKTATLVLGVSAKTFLTDKDGIIDDLFELEATAKNALDKDLQIGGKAITVEFDETLYEYLDENILDARFTVQIKTQPIVTGGR